MTSLKEQLDRLALTHVKHSLVGRKSSLLYGSKEIQSVEREVIFELGLSGLSELIKIRDQFIKYEKLLFQRNLINMDRTLQNKNFNTKLNKIIKNFLIEVSPYILLKCAQKALEWIVHRYKIELFNVDDLIMVFLPFHHTNFFAKLLSIINLDKFTFKWNWLNDFSKSGVALPKSVIINHLKSDSVFLQATFSKPDEYLDVFKASDSNMELVIGYCTSLALCLLQEGLPKEEVASTLIQYIIKGLKSDCQIWELSCYAVLANLTSSVHLNEKMVNTLISQISKHHSDDLFKEAFCCLTLLIQKQNHVIVKNYKFINLTLTEKKLIEIQVISQNFDVLPTLKLIYTSNKNKTVYLLLKKIEKLRNKHFIEPKEFHSKKSDNISKNYFNKFSLVSEEFVSKFCDIFEKKFDNNMIKSFENIINSKKLKSRAFHDDILNILNFIFTDIKLQERKLKQIIEKLCYLHKDLPLQAKYIVIKTLSFLIKKISSKEYFASLSSESFISFFVPLFSTQFSIIIPILRCSSPRLFSSLVEDNFIKMKFEIKCNNFQEFLSQQFSLSLNSLFSLTIHLKTFSESEKKKHLHFKNSVLKILKDVIKILSNDPNKKKLLKELTNFLIEKLEKKVVFEAFLNYLIELQTMDYLNVENKETDHFITVTSDWFFKKLYDDQFMKDQKNQLIVILLLTNGHWKIRTIALEILNNLSNSNQFEKTHACLIKKLYFFKNEITNDSSYAVQFFCNILPSSNKLNVSFESILLLLSETNENFYLKFNIFKVLENCKNKKIIERVILCIQDFIKKIKENEDVYENLVLLKQSFKVLFSNKPFLQEDSLKIYLILIEILNGIFKNLEKKFKIEMITSACELIRDDFLNTLPDDETRLMIIKKVIDLSLQENLSFLSVTKTTLKNITISHKLMKNIIKTEMRCEKETKKKKIKLDFDLDIQKTEIIFEALQTSEHLDTSKEMCGLLCECLSQVVGKDLNYCCQLLLIFLRKIISFIEPHQARKFENFLNVEVLVQILRTSYHFQVQHHVILVLTTISPLFPEQFLHNIVSIFTFMGSNFFQKDDFFSFQILSKLITVALSTVENFSKSSSQSKEELMLNILRVFVDSKSHIPSHRIVLIFKQLLDFAVDKYLWKLVLLLIESNVRQKESVSVDIKKHGIFELDLIVSLFSCYSVITQLKAIFSIIKFLNIFIDVFSLQSNQLNFGVLENIKSLPILCRMITFYMNRVISELLTDQLFISQFLTLIAESEEREKFQEIFEKIFNQLIIYMLSISKKQKIKPQNSVFEKFWIALQKLVQNNLEKINYLLPSSMFVNVVLSLLSNDSVEVRCRGLQLLHSKLNEHQQNFYSQEAQNSIKIIPILIKFLDESNDKLGISDEKSFYLIQQLCFLNLKILCRFSTSLDSSQISNLCSLSINALKTLNKNNIAVADSALLCLSELMRLPKTNLVNLIQPIMISIISLLQNDLITNSGLSFNCLLSLLNKSIFNLGSFLNPHLDALISSLCFLSSKHDLYQQSKDRMNQSVSLISSTIHTRLLLPCIIKAYTTIASQNHHSYISLFKLSQLHLQTLEKQEANNNIKLISELICIFLNIRIDASQLNHEELLELEEIYKEIVLSFVIHLSETSFKPLFEKLYNKIDFVVCRGVTFFNLMCGLSSKLKSIFNVFASSLVNLMVKLLEKNNLAKKINDDTKKLTKEVSEEQNETKYNKIMIQRIYDVKNDKLTNFLQNLILRFITLCYSVDLDGSFSSQNTDLLLEPLVDQIENTSTDFEERVSQYLVPCFSQIAPSIKENDLLIRLNRNICNKLKHHRKNVRIASIKILRCLAESLGNVYEILFPETAPYLAELLEEEGEEMYEAQLLKESIEAYIGKLDNFF